MSIWKSLTGVLAEVKGIFTEAGKAIDSTFTSDEERLAARNRNQELQNELVGKVLDHGMELAKIEAEADKAKLELMAAEAKSESKLTRAIRPTLILSPLAVLLLDLLARVICGFFEIPYDGLSHEEKEGLLNLLMVFGGVYGLGRSGEKISRSWKVRPPEDKK